jgi:RNA exonuclease 1
LKKRTPPDSVSHPSVGTEEELAERAESRKKLDSLCLTRDHLVDLILTVADMQKWGYVVEIPGGQGGSRPSEEGKIMKCERCAQPFMVKRKDEAEECNYHWGKQYNKIINGMFWFDPVSNLSHLSAEKTRIYTCCSRPIAEGGGCVHGPHVFYESGPDDLHARHPFTHTWTPLDEPSSSAPTETALDVVALDCEMIYTTGGMRVARVSVVDGSGREVFDELVQMDDGVEVMCVSITIDVSR